MKPFIEKISDYFSANQQPLEPVACQLNNAELAERRNYLLQHFASAIQQTKPVKNGYAFTFHGDEDTLTEVMKLVKMERKCCRFLQFQLHFSHEQQPLQLKITGPKGTQQFLQQLFRIS